MVKSPDCLCAFQLDHSDETIMYALPSYSFLKECYGDQTSNVLISRVDTHGAFGGSCQVGDKGD